MTRLREWELRTSSPSLSVSLLLCCLLLPPPPPLPACPPSGCLTRVVMNALDTGTGGGTEGAMTGGQDISEIQSLRVLLIIAIRTGCLTRQVVAAAAAATVRRSFRRDRAGWGRGRAQGPHRGSCGATRHHPRKPARVHDRARTTQQTVQRAGTPTAGHLLWTRPRISTDHQHQQHQHHQQHQPHQQRQNHQQHHQHHQHHQHQHPPSSPSLPPPAVADPDPAPPPSSWPM